MTEIHPKLFMPVFIGKYLAETQDLSAKESGAYLHLCFHYWIKRGDVRLTFGKLIQICRLRTESDTETDAVTDVVLSYFKTRKDSETGLLILKHTYLDELLEKYYTLRDKREKASKVANEAKKRRRMFTGKTGNRTGVKSDTESQAESDPIINKDYKEKRNSKRKGDIKSSLEQWEGMNGILTIDAPGILQFIESENLDRKKVAAELERFRLKCRSHGYQYVDFAVAFESWMRSEEYGSGIEGLRADRPAASGPAKELLLAQAIPSLPTDIARKWWKANKSILQVMGDNAYRSYFSELLLTGYDNGVVTVTCPSAFIAAWINEHHRDKITYALKSHFPEYSDLKLNVKDKQP